MKRIIYFVSNKIQKGKLMLFGAAYYPEHRDPSKWDFDLDTMAEMSVNALRVGEFAWKRFEPQDGAFDFSWMDEFRDRAAKRGIQLLMCPPLRTAPAWLVSQDPSILMENDAGIRLSFGSRYTFCINHPLLREKGLRLAETMAKHYGADKHILGWHLDNEYGDEPDCHCPVCTHKWHAWLCRRYSDIQTLNRKWGLVFWGLELDSFDQAPTPRVSKTWHGPGHMQAWRRFRSDCTCEMIGLHADTVRRYASDQPITTNFQSLWNFRTDFYQAHKHLDVCGMNYYPPYGHAARQDAMALANTYSFKRKPFHVHELRNSAHAMPGQAQNSPAPGEMERLTLHAVANGADGVFYFRWRACPFGIEQTHGTITDYDGRPRRAHRELSPVGARLRKLAPFLDGSGVASQAGILYDYPSRWATETGDFWHGDPRLYLEHSKMLHARLRAQGINVATLGRSQGFDQFRLLVVPNLSVVDDVLAGRLYAYVENGGTLVWHPQSGARDMDCGVFPRGLHPRLRDLLGVDIQEYATGGTDETQSIVWNGKEFAGRCFFDQPSLTSAQARAEYTNCWFAGLPALTANAVGSGTALYIGSFMEKAFYDALFEKLVDECGIHRILGCIPPDPVEVVCRQASDGREFVFVLNYSADAHQVPAPDRMRDVYNDEDIDGMIELGPGTVRILTLAKGWKS
ncbi:MAG: hypothetical protein GF418_11960 [Chitinivibrionales bacterium]|nr:hypothetical protein [Chitinivibrionales bacterium]MBD3396332.1 hypothetical protein [Chitinivibrionales bacterium]